MTADLSCGAREKMCILISSGVAKQRIVGFVDRTGIAMTTEDTAHEQVAGWCAIRPQNTLQNSAEQAHAALTFRDDDAKAVEGMGNAGALEADVHDRHRHILNLG